jgi:hypothetical protein
MSIEKKDLLISLLTYDVSPAGIRGSGFFIVKELFRFPIVSRTVHSTIDEGEMPLNSIKRYVIMQKGGYSMSASMRTLSIMLVCVILTTPGIIGCKKEKEEAKQKYILEKIIIPPPNMIFAALQSSGTINWKTIITYNDETNYTSFEKIALNLGIRVADGFVAIMAENRNDMTRMGKAIKVLAKKIGIGDQILQKTGEIDSNIINELEQRQDYEVSYFCNLGAWFEALFIASKSLNEKYDPQMAENLRQKGLVDVFLEGFDMLSEKTKEDPLVQLIKEKLTAIGPLLDFPRGKSLSRENAKKLFEITTDLKTEIEKI